MSPNRLAFLAAALLLAATALADVPETTIPPELIRPEAQELDVEGQVPLLPRHETQAERDFWRGRDAERPDAGMRADPPPLGPIRNCAEWEPCTGVLVRWPLGLPYNLLRDFDDDVTLHVIASSTQVATARAAFVTNGVDTSRVQFLVRPSDSIWTRDYGPWYVFDGNGDMAIIDHEYNRPSRPNDDVIPYYFALQQGLPVHRHDMYHTGGNYMTDGAHVSSSTDLVYDEALGYNGMTSAEVDQLMFDYYGVETYNVVDDIESGGIHHIDTWAKFLDEETVLVKQVAPSHYTYAALEQRATLLASLEASTGRPYRVHRVFCQQTSSGPASYTNSLILNDAIYVPFFNSPTNDQAALAAYRAAAPGYLVRGYYYGGFLSDDALHCRAKGVKDRSMLRVAHVPIVADQPSGAVSVTAHVRAHSDSALTDARLWYRHGAQPWSSTALLPTGAPDEFAAQIPAASQPDSCSYYLQVADASGRVEGYPRVAPQRWLQFWHDAGLTAVADAPAAATLHANAPNPFNPSTTFAFELREADRVRLVVLDARGRLVRTLIDGRRPAGRTEVVWRGDDDAGRPVAAGTYVYRLQAAGLQYTRTATLVK